MWDNKTFKRRFLQAQEAKNQEMLHTLRISVFRDTVATVEAEQYINGHGQTVLLPRDKQLIEKSVLYFKELPNTTNPSFLSRVEVLKDDCLAVARQAGENPLVLNMANAFHPGGGVETGSGAQEEHLFRSSNYFLSLYQYSPTLHKTYKLPKAKQSYPLDPAFGAVYSPLVTVFRGKEEDGYPLLDTPFKASFMAVPAINGPELSKNAEGIYVMSEKDRALTKQKMRTMFTIAKIHAHDTLVLSAFGCGAFCNPPTQIAQLFHQVLLEAPFKTAFKRIIFAIKDDHNTCKWYNPTGNYLPFVQEFKDGKL